jgi:inner membrane protein
MIPQEVFFFLALIIFSILPDIDSARSYLGKRARPLSTILQLFLDHRAFFHSLLFIIAGTVIMIILSPTIALAFLVGAGSHLFLDALTREGIRPFYPLKRRVRGAIKTGSLIEFAFFAALLIATVSLALDTLNF